MSTMPTIEYRIDVTGIPHTYVVMNNGAGIEQMYGFGPAASGSLWGKGQIYDESVSGPLGTAHPSDFTTGPIQVTADQYNRVANEINNAIANPPYYSVPQSVSLSDAVNQCANWANHLAEVGGFTGSLPWGANGWNPYGQAESLRPYFPDYGGDPVGGMRWPGNPGTPDNPSGPIVPYGPTGPSGPGSNGGISPTCGRDYGAAKNWVPPRRDPLVLDLDGGGITTSAINPAAPIYFDQDGDGTLTATGWIGAGEAIVVRDLNGNGLIDSGRELFGDSTVLTHGPNAGQLAANGFAALADLDANAAGSADGQFDSNDVAFNSVKYLEFLCVSQNSMNKRFEFIEKWVV